MQFSVSSQMQPGSTAPPFKTFNHQAKLSLAAWPQGRHVLVPGEEAPHQPSFKDAGPPHRRVGACSGTEQQVSPSPSMSPRCDLRSESRLHRLPRRRLWRQVGLEGLRGLPRGLPRRLVWGLPRAGAAEAAAATQVPEHRQLKRSFSLLQSKRRGNHPFSHVCHACHPLKHSRAFAEGFSQISGSSDRIALLDYWLGFVRPQRRDVSSCLLQCLRVYGFCDSGREWMCFMDFRIKDMLRAAALDPIGRQSGTLHPFA